MPFYNVEEKEKEKKALFDELYQLDDESDGPKDKSIASIILKHSKLPTTQGKKKTGVFRTNNGLSPSHSLSRTVSAPIGRNAVSFPGSIYPGHLSMAPSIANPSISEASREFPMLDQQEQPNSAQKSMTTKLGKKRKRGQSFDALPDSQQIFKGLSFFFFPNNNVAAARGFRIRKAMEWGALWIKTWKDGITHIVMDKNLSCKDLLTFLKVPTVPRDVVVVNEDYPADCIRFRSIVNPGQPQYRVSGVEEPVGTSPSTHGVVASQTSLQLKPDKEEIAHLLQTPSRTEESGAELPASTNERSKADEDVTHVLDSMPSSME